MKKLLFLTILISSLTSYSQDFTQHIGDVAMTFSPYTLNDHQFSGSGIDATPTSKLKISAMYGRLIRPVEFDVNPQENLVVSIDGKVKLFGNVILNVEYVTSGITEDTKATGSSENSDSLEIFFDQN